MKTNTIPQQIKDSVRELYEAQREKKEAENYYNEVRKKEQVVISNYMFSNLPKGEESFEVTLDSGKHFYANHTKLRVTRVRKTSVTWDTDKLKKALSKEQFKRATTKEYSVTDMDGLVKYLKSCGVDPKKFKKYIDVSTQVNVPALEQMYETGELKMSDVAGCYTKEVGEPYMRLTEIKDNGTEV